MTKKLSIFSVLFLLLIVSCKEPDPNQQIDEGRITGEIYTSQEIGWTMEIPEGWSIVSKDKLAENTERGIEAIEQVGGDFDYSGLKQLINFQKNQFNVFQSTSEPFELAYEGEWKANNSALKELLYATYENQGLRIDTASATATIDELVFEVFHITVYSPDDKVLLYQDMYSRYINGYDFGVNLNYNNEADKLTMLKAWENSKFQKK